MRTIDAYRQLANLEARVAAQRANKRPDQFDFGPDEDGVTEDAAALFALAEKRLDDLAPLDQSAEWHAIRGSLFKKRASTLTGDAQRDELRRSMDAYRAAVKVNNPQESAEVQLDVYHSSLTLLMAYALGLARRHIDPLDLPRAAGGAEGLVRSRGRRLLGAGQGRRRQRHRHRDQRSADHRGRSSQTWSRPSSTRSGSDRRCGTGHRSSTTTATSASCCRPRS